MLFKGDALLLAIEMYLCKYSCLPGRRQIAEESFDMQECN